MIKLGFLRAEQERNRGWRVTKAREKKNVLLIVPAPTDRQQIPLKESDFKPSGCRLASLTKPRHKCFGATLTATA